MQHWSLERARFLHIAGRRTAIEMATFRRLLALRSVHVIRAFVASTTKAITESQGLTLATGAVANVGGCRQSRACRPRAGPLPSGAAENPCAIGARRRDDGQGL